jgi:hypothetical protein
MLRRSEPGTEAKVREPQGPPKFSSSLNGEHIHEQFREHIHEQFRELKHLQRTLSPEDFIWVRKFSVHILHML